MYDSLKGKYRDSFVNFYTGDMHTNELSYSLVRFQTTLTLA